MQKVPFLREATGLVREVRAVDAWIFNVMAISLGTGVALTFTLGPALFPGGSIPIAIATFAILCLFKDLLYSQLGTAMPRSGGEYVFQGRILDFMAPWAVGNQISYNVIWQGCIYQALNGIMFATMGLAPLVVMVGSLTSNNALLAFGAWMNTPIGLYIIILVDSAVSIAIVALGIKFYMEKFQRVLFAIGMAGTIAIISLFATNTQASFITKFNMFAEPFFNNPDSYHYIIETANVSTKFSWVSTIGLMAFVSFALIWAHGIIHNFGEVKRGSDLKLYSIVFMAGTLFTGAFMLIIGLLMVNVCGQEFLTAIGNLAFIQPATYKLPLPPFHTLLASVLTDNIWLIVLINGSLMAWALQWSTNNSLGYSRLVLALSFDRILPAKLGEVNERFRSPINSLIFFFIVGAVGFGALVAFMGVGGALTAAVLAQIFNFLTTAVAGILFPYRKKDIYEASPASRWKIGGLPLVVLCGVVTLILQLVLLYTFIAIPGVGVSDPLALGIVFGIIVFGIVYFIAVKYYRKSQGIDLNVLFQALPPE